MAILQYNEITVKKNIIFDGEPYKVLESLVFRMQQRKPVNQTKLKNLISGRVTEHAFHQQEKVEEAEIESRKIKFLYTNRGEFWFCEENNPSKRFSIPSDVIGTPGNFLKAGTLVDLQTFKDKIVGVEVPIKMTLKVTSAPPTVRGNTSQGAIKQITLETGATINAPLFVNDGDTVVVNTQSGEYSERG